MSLSPKLKASYTAIIDDLLSRSDFETVSVRRIRKGIEAQTGDDLTTIKDVIGELIDSRFDIAFPAEPTSPKPPPARTSVKPDPTASSPPATPVPTKAKPNPKPKPKPKPTTTKTPTPLPESDAALAARLQAEENLLHSSARPSRSTAAAPKKRRLAATSANGPSPAPKKRRPSKSATKVSAADDSAVSSDSAAEAAAPRTGAFHKPMLLSAPLAELLDGETHMSRPQTVKRIWAYVKERDLQDPADRRQIRCDEGLKRVFGCERVHMFTMNKLLSKCLRPLDEES